MHAYTCTHTPRYCLFAHIVSFIRRQIVEYCYAVAHLRTHTVGSLHEQFIVSDSAVRQQTASSRLFHSHPPLSGNVIILLLLSAIIKHWHIRKTDINISNNKHCFCNSARQVHSSVYPLVTAFTCSIGAVTALLTALPLLLLPFTFMISISKL